MSPETLFPVIIGLILIIIGISNTRGNISTIHSYHRKRVSEEDRLPFGRLAGAGTITIGTSIIAMGGLSFAAEYLNNGIYTTIGYAVLIAGLVIGLGLSFYAMIKYNKGIF